MNKPLIITVLSVSLSISSLALGEEHMSLYTENAASPEISGELDGGYIEKDFMDFYLAPIVPESEKERLTPVLIAESGDIDPEAEREYINVFGVMVPVRI